MNWKFNWQLKLVSTLIIYLLLDIQVAAQNIGIGTSTPSEKLDVNGNINLNGILKVNNAAGLPGQVLMKSTNNTLIWGDPSSSNTSGGGISGYKRNFIIKNTGSGTFQVPSGITNVLVEIWGAGGAGPQGGVFNYFCPAPADPNVTYWECPYGVKWCSGGGGGGYLRASLNVTEGQNLSYYVGSGTSRDGDSSFVNIGSTALLAQGGKFGDTTSNINPTLPSSLGMGGSYKGPTSINNNINYFVGSNGANGTRTYSPLFYDYINSATFYHGNGGDAGNTINTGGTGGISIAIISSDFVGNDPVSERVSAKTGDLGSRHTEPQQPGGGGPVKSLYLTGGPSRGANGMIIFWW